MGNERGDLGAPCRFFPAYLWRQEQSTTVLFEGTPVRLRLSREVSSANAQVGDAVNFDVVEDVRLGNVAVIAKGSHALGKITTVVPKRRMGRAGKLDMSVEYVRYSRRI